MPNQSKIIAFIATISILVGLSLFVSYRLFDEASMRDWLSQALPTGPFGALTLYTLLSLATALGLPRQIAAFSAGYGFGIWSGTLIATLAATTGCYLTYMISRHCFRGLIVEKYPKQLAMINEFFQHQLLTKAVIIRLLPAGSNFLTNVLAGVANLAKRPFILGSGIGFIPQMLIFALAGHGIRLGAEQHLMISLVLFVIALMLSYWLYRRSTFGKQLGYSQNR